MYARIERRKVAKARIVLTAENKKRICKRFNISDSTLSKYLTDVFNDNVTASARNEVLVTAINEYRGKLEETKTWKDVVVIDKHDNPENHIGD